MVGSLPSLAAAPWCIGKQKKSIEEFLLDGKSSGSLISSLVTWGRNDGWHEKTHVVTQTSQDKKDDDFEKQKKKSTITEGKNLEKTCVNNRVKFTTFLVEKCSCLMLLKEHQKTEFSRQN